MLKRALRLETSQSSTPTPLSVNPRYQVALVDLCPTIAIKPLFGNHCRVFVQTPSPVIYSPSNHCCLLIIVPDYGPFDHCSPPIMDTSTSVARLLLSLQPSSPIQLWSIQPSLPVDYDNSNHHCPSNDGPFDLHRSSTTIPLTPVTTNYSPSYLLHQPITIPPNLHRLLTTIHPTTVAQVSTKVHSTSITC
ncbi:hypothetical protein MA16_Dca002015 [Dendrobium catenatum]|uniref:Uncharacterized protein n=1 Tax=Dendrobium catenatum TaxID=906689 RepID=A0A2I0XE63_9ASPA|nr:hypothetical protein MA16_Dca002015 [Dendrobium catenatum]